MKFLTTLLALSVTASIAFAKDEKKSAAAAGPTDAEIAHIVVVANTVDIDAGKLAAKQSKNKEIQKFAQQMVTDHSGVNAQAVDLVTKLGVTPADNAVSQGLKAGGDKNIAKLKTLKGAAFDKAYIDNEVAYHEAVMNALDKVLVPNAKNAELKALLIKVRPAFVAHLDHAKSVQAKFKK